MNLVEQVKNAGVVGAGGAGFPTHVKLSSKVEWMLANGAECEPLLHKDRELMLHFPSEIIQGLQLATQSVQAKRAVFGIKSKNKTAIESLEKNRKDFAFEIKEFGDYYPAGDEYELVYGITGRLIPPAGIPLQIGVVVNNVETLYNIYQASKGIPVTHTFLTITGLVKEPKTVRVPVGSSISDILKLAGGPTISQFAIMESGLLMGKLVTDLQKPVTKTTGGLIVLPADHSLIERYTKPPKMMDRIGHSACDQCSYCTELCPRYLLGYQVQPHLVMRSLGFSVMGPELWNQYALLCCGCGLCTLYSCPESLYPREACERGIENLRSIGKGKWAGTTEVKVHPMKDSRRIPLKHLMQKLGVTQYDSHAAFSDVKFEPDQVQIPLKQHIGNAAKPIVNTGDKVKFGQLIADVPDDKLGAKVHASVAGQIREISEQFIIIERA
ncbi:4Fe-4S dicluster domain-containing protein [candidate division KSB1 bacterium]|nr:4Fe-4S dicluster domain-containing protein [candidate division KSB1 bacterium]